MSSHLWIELLECLIGQLDRPKSLANERKSRVVLRPEQLGLKKVDYLLAHIILSQCCMQ